MKKILIVNHDSSLTFSLNELITSFGYKTEIATTGESAVLLVKQILPDLVLLDLNLPDMKGIQVLQEIKKSQSNLQVAILCSKINNNALTALKLGACDIIETPVNPRELELIIKTNVDTTNASKDLMQNLRDDFEKFKIEITNEIELLKKQFKSDEKKSECALNLSSRNATDAHTKTIDEEMTLSDIEKIAITRALIRYNGNKNLVAQKLGINRTTLYTKIKKYNL